MRRSIAGVGSRGFLFPLQPATYLKDHLSRFSCGWHMRAAQPLGCFSKSAVPFQVVMGSDVWHSQEDWSTKCGLNFRLACFPS